MRRAVVVLLGLSSLSALSQPILSDRFEDTLLKTQTPPGAWDLLYYALPSQSPSSFAILPTSSAALRGQVGLLIFDNHVASGSGGSGYLVRRLNPAPSHYVQFWYRTAASNGEGTSSFFSLASEAQPGMTMMETRLNAANHSLEFLCMGRQQSTVLVGSGEAPEGVWHFIELGLEWAGTQNARCVAFVNHRLAGSQVVDMTGVLPTEATLGQHSALYAATSTLHIDDFQLSTAPLASQLKLSSTRADLNECARIEVTLTQPFDGGAAVVTWPMQLAVSTDSSDAKTFVNSDCSIEAAQLDIVANQQGLSFYVRSARSGFIEVRAESAALAPASLKHPVGLDVPGKPNLYGATFGCQTTPSMFALWLLIGIGRSLCSRRRGRCN